jgi:hypothetical protein
MGSNAHRIPKPHLAGFCGLATNGLALPMLNDFPRAAQVSRAGRRQGARYSRIASSAGSRPARKSANVGGA